jgi:hypothetical protein
MTTQTFRVVRVRSAGQSPVARIEAVNDDGHELRLEVQADLVRGAGEGQLLLVHWSLVNQAGAAQGGAARPSRTRASRLSSSTPSSRRRAAPAAPRTPPRILRRSTRSSCR